MVKVKQKKPLTRKYFQACGSKGGKMNKKKGKEYFSLMGKRSAIKRWGNKQTNEK